MTGAGVPKRIDKKGKRRQDKKIEQGGEPCSKTQTQRYAYASNIELSRPLRLSAGLSSQDLDRAAERVARALDLAHSTLSHL
jgi:hypothetical protein